MRKIIDWITVTIPCQESQHIFQIALNDLDLQRLQEERILGFTFRKEKYRFLHDLADVLAEHILIELEKLP